MPPIAALGVRLHPPGRQSLDVAVARWRVLYQRAKCRDNPSFAITQKKWLPRISPARPLDRRKFGWTAAAALTIIGWFQTRLWT